jgi:hypothetical protein
MGSYNPTPWELFLKGERPRGRRCIMQSIAANQWVSRSLRHFARSIIFIVLLSIFLAACGQSSSNNTASPSGDTASKGTLSGNVVLSPTCPTERTDGACAPRVAAFRQVRVMSTRQVITTTTTDKQGHFAMLLAPGDYTVLINNLSPGVRKPAQGVPVHIKAGQIYSVKIVLDTGIR